MQPTVPSLTNLPPTIVSYINLPCPVTSTPDKYTNMAGKVTANFNKMPSAFF